MIARVECCRCHRDMGTKEGFERNPGCTEEIVSHGLCAACVDEVMAEWEFTPPRRENALHLHRQGV